MALRVAATRVAIAARPAAALGLSPETVAGLEALFLERLGDTRPPSPG